MREADTQDTTDPVRILIVDDHPNTAAMLARVLAKFEAPVEVITASSGEDALAKIGDEMIDILITDFMMPGLNGLELIEKMKGDQKPAHTILITAYDTPGLAITARRLNIQDYLVKPVQPEKIRSIVARVIEELRPPARRLPPAAKRSFKILIADDYPDNLRLLSTRLQSEGYTFIPAWDGEETMCKIREEDPDLVLLDVNMPKKDGFQVLAEMRADPAIAHIPVIMITAARINPRDVREGLSLGADDYVIKPFDWRELAARIQSKLRVKQAEDILRRRTRELGILPEIGQELSARLNVEDLSQIVVNRTLEALEAGGSRLDIFGMVGGGERVICCQRGSEDSQAAIQDVSRDEAAGWGLFAYVAASRQGAVVENIGNDPRWRSPEDIGIGSAVGVPLLGRNDVIGVLTLTHRQLSYFTSEHLTLLQAIASQAAIAIENAQLFGFEHRRVQEMMALNQIMQETQRFTHAQQLLDNLPKLVKDRLGYRVVAVWRGDKLATDHGEIALSDLCSVAGDPGSIDVDLFVGVARQAAGSRVSVMTSGPVASAQTAYAEGDRWALEEANVTRRSSRHKAVEALNRQVDSGVSVADVITELPRPYSGSAVAVPLLGEDGRGSLFAHGGEDAEAENRSCAAIGGVLAVYSPDTDVFSNSDCVLLETLATQVVSALERVALFESVEQEQRRLLAVLRSAADAILVMDAQMRLILANPAGELLFPDAEARVGQALPQGEGYEGLIGLLERVHQAGKRCQGEVNWPDGRTFSAVITPVEGGVHLGGTPSVAVLHDVSQFKALADLKNEYIATASHDLKNPIMSVLGFNDLLAKAGPLNEMQEDFIRRIRSSALQMRDLVLNLLEISRLESGSAMSQEMLDLHELLEKTTLEHSEECKSKGQTLSLEFCEVQLYLYGDSILLQQLVHNLVSNAIKYTPEGGEVAVATRLELDDGGVAEAGSGRGWAVIDFQDSGIGIPTQDLPFIFNKFYRVQSDATRDIEGTGLGLAIVKSIVENHKGRITVRSTEGEGTCFTVYLPLALAGAELAADALPGSAG